MANKYDLKTALMSVASDGAVMTTIGAKVGSGIIASGKTRFLTYIRVNRTSVASGMTAVTGYTDGGIIVCGLSSISGAAEFGTYSAATAMTDGMLGISLQHVNMSDISAPGMPPQVALVQNIPDRPDIDHPILAVGGGSALMGVYVPSGPACRIFAQYYDE